MRALFRVVMVGAVTTLLTGCSGEGQTAASITAHPTEMTTGQTATTPATDTQDLTTTTTTEATTTTSSIAETTTTEEDTTTTLPPFPPARENLEHGGETWAVILAASEDFDDPTLDQAVTDATAAGYNTGPTDCDVGVAEALGLPADGVASVSVYLESEADAEAALVAFEARGVDGTVALLNTFCLD